jgi:hypothetical protein
MINFHKYISIFKCIKQLRLYNIFASLTKLFLLNSYEIYTIRKKIELDTRFIKHTSYEIAFIVLYLTILIFTSKNSISEPRYFYSR